MEQQALYRVGGDIELVLAQTTKAVLLNRPVTLGLGQDHKVGVVRMTSISRLANRSFHPV